MQAINPNHQSIQINLRSDDDEVQGIVDGDVALSFDFNRTIQIPSNYVCNISVARAEIPVSYYSFDFEWEFQLSWGVGGEEWTVTVPIGIQNWSPCKIVNYIKAYVITHQPADSGNYPLFTFNCNTLKYICTEGEGNDEDSLQITMRKSGTGTFTTNEAKLLITFFGLDVGPEIALVLEPSSFSLVADAARLHTISITSKVLNTDSIDSRAGGEHVLAKVPVNAPFGSIVLYKGNLVDGYLYRQQSVNRIDIALRDHNGDLIKLNGGRYNVSLICQFVRRNDDIFHDLPMGLPLAPVAGPTIGYQTNNEQSLSYKKRIVDYMRRRRPVARGT